MSVFLMPGWMLTDREAIQNIGEGGIDINFISHSLIFFCFKFFYFYLILPSQKYIFLNLNFLNKTGLVSRRPGGSRCKKTGGFIRPFFAYPVDELVKCLGDSHFIDTPKGKPAEIHVRGIQAVFNRIFIEYIINVEAQR